MIAAAVAIWIYGAFDPGVARWFPRCVIKELTGLDCPGCGSQRAIHALLTGHPGEAWRFNAALVISLPLMAFIIGARHMEGRWPRLARFVGSRGFILSIFALLVAWTVGRNVW